MTTALAALRRLRDHAEDHLDGIEPAPIVTGAAIFLAAFITGLAFGGIIATLVVLAVAYLWTVLTGAVQAARTDEAIDGNDITRGVLDEVWEQIAALADALAAFAGSFLDDDDDAPDDTGHPTQLELDRWADDGGFDPNNEGDRRPVLAPITQPAPRIDLAGGLRLPPGRHAHHGPLRPAAPPPADADDIDRRLAVFHFQEGHSR